MALSLLKQAGISEVKDWMVILAGCRPEGEYEKELQALISKYHLSENIMMIGQQFGKDMQSCYYHADAYILPSYSEGMPLAALDAWAYGKYSLLTEACNLSDGIHAGVSCKIEPDPDSIAEGLKYLFTLDHSDLHDLGAKARAFVSREYSWKVMAEKMSQVYQWISGNMSQPKEIITS
jgi:poly(glycerol-phosphate) alpha-glucosyltransferase